MEKLSVLSSSIPFHLLSPFHSHVSANRMASATSVASRNEVIQNRSNQKRDNAAKTTATAEELERHLVTGKLGFPRAFPPSVPTSHLPFRKMPFPLAVPVQIAINVGRPN